MEEKTNYRIAEARERARMTQQEAADALGVTVQGYQNYEYGKRDLKASKICELCRIFGCSASFLLGITSGEAESGVVIDRRKDEIDSTYDMLDETGRELLLTSARGLLVSHKGEDADARVERSA